MSRLVIFGAGDIARLAHFYFQRDSEHEIVAFTVDGAYRDSDTFQGMPLVDFESLPDRYPPSDYMLFVAVSYTRLNQVRASRFLAAKSRGYSLPSYISSRCTYLADEPPGENCFILEDNTVQPFARIGSNVTLWSGNHVGHDSTIGDHTFIASHVVISGHVQIGTHCFIGVNATLRNGIHVAPHTVIGAAAIVMRDTHEREVYVAPRTEVYHKNSDAIEL